jgi:hypothetical protein
MHSLNMSKSAAVAPVKTQGSSFPSPKSVPLQPTSTKVYSSAKTGVPAAAQPGPGLRHA